jgi:hypothetical protein
MNIHGFNGLRSVSLSSRSSSHQNVQFQAIDLKNLKAVDASSAQSSDEIKQALMACSTLDGRTKSFVLRYDKGAITMLMKANLSDQDKQALAQEGFTIRADIGGGIYTAQAKDLKALLAAAKHKQVVSIQSASSLSPAGN